MGKLLHAGDPGTEIFGFDAASFTGWIFIDEQQKELVFSMVISKVKRKGNFKRCVVNALERGYRVVVPTPMPLMEHIVKKWGFKKVDEFDPVMGRVETYQKSGSLKGDKK